MNNDSKFSSGFLMGLIIGGSAVFLLGTKTGKNLLKIISEQGLEGLTALLEEYGLEDFEEEYEDVPEEQHVSNNHQETVAKKDVEEKTETPKKRFFKRVRR